eukprot:3575034-Pyramimonas_sp.AAC.1
MWEVIPALLSAARDLTTLGPHWQAAAAAAAQCPSLPAMPACPELVCASGPPLACRAPHCECTCPAMDGGYWLLLAGAGVEAGAALGGLAAGAAAGFAPGRATSSGRTLAEA